MDGVKANYTHFVCQQLEADKVASSELIQTLWSGYGEILKLELQGGRQPSVVLKYIVLPDEVKHPRGWGGERSHARKERSYDVEMHWYRGWGQRCDATCRITQCYGTLSRQGEHVILLEDLDAAGFSQRRVSLQRDEVLVCLHWLANFHATFLNVSPGDLWPVGTYWHLATRPDEFDEMPSSPLKNAAHKIDERLNHCRFQTLVHGDAKVANFCFSEDMSAVAAVDFQYVGGGCGIKDVAYFLGSCLDESQCQAWAPELLDAYFDFLHEALKVHGQAVDSVALEGEWRDLYAYAWADFYRFLIGWMPNHKKIHNYTKSLANEVVVNIS